MVAEPQWAGDCYATRHLRDTIFRHREDRYDRFYYCSKSWRHSPICSIFATDIGMVDQWYRMNKARTFEEWLAAMRMQQLPSLHTVYADRHSNIFYVYNGLLPADRSPHYDWSGILPGNTSETLWHEYLPFDMLPNITNPKSKFVQVILSPLLPHFSC